MPRVRSILALACLLAGTAPASAAFVVAPGALATTEGNDHFQFSGNVATFQQVYGVSQFAGLSVGDQITGMQFRMNGPHSDAPFADITVGHFDVYLGPSNFSPGSLSSSVAANQGAGTVLARGGALDISYLSYPGGNGPNPFGPVIAFATPYTYTGGPLLLTLSFTRPNANLDFDAARGLPDVQARTTSGYNNPDVVGDMGDYALVVQFTTDAELEPTPTPEPSGLALLGVGAALTAVALRRGRSAIVDAPELRG